MPKLNLWKNSSYNSPTVRWRLLRERSPQKQKKNVMQWTTLERSSRRDEALLHLLLLLTVGKCVTPPPSVCDCVFDVCDLGERDFKLCARAESFHFGSRRGAVGRLRYSPDLANHPPRGLPMTSFFFCLFFFSMRMLSVELIETIDLFSGGCSSSFDGLVRCVMKIIMEGSTR